MSLLSLSRRPGLRKLQILLLASIAWVLFAEGGYRAYLAFAGRPYSAVSAQAQLDELLGKLRGTQFMPKSDSAELDKGGLAIHPYSGYHIWRFTRGAQELANYFSSREAEQNYDILLLGGSVACVFGNYSGSSLVPALSADPRLAGRKIRVHVLACPGHKQPQHVNTLEWALAQGYHPDAVILLDGFNEIAVAAENAKAGVNPLFPYWIEMQMRLGNAMTDAAALELLGRAVGARDEAEASLCKPPVMPRSLSAILGTWQVKSLERAVNKARLTMVKVQQQQQQDKSAGTKSITVGGPPFDPDPARVRQVSIQAWREGSLAIQAICNIHGIPFLHVLQPSPCDTGSKPLTDQEKFAVEKSQLWSESIAAAYPLMRKVGRNLASHGVNFLDATQIYADHPGKIYIDTCHFEAEGAGLLGKLVAETFLKTVKF
ncbi:MAG: hypothetical protein IPJ19_04110 [Planctomycetes bacterium]|nr:hypothetical protein [Planctomycetota bacterium]